MYTQTRFVFTLQNITSRRKCALAPSIYECNLHIHLIRKSVDPFSEAPMWERCDHIITSIQNAHRVTHFYCMPSGCQHKLRDYNIVRGLYSLCDQCTTSSWAGGSKDWKGSTLCGTTTRHTESKQRSPRQRQRDVVCCQRKISALRSQASETRELCCATVFNDIRSLLYVCVFCACVDVGPVLFKPSLV